MNLRHRLTVIVLVLAIAGAAEGPAIAQAQLPQAAAAAVAPTGRLRVGVYPGSPTSLIRGQNAGEEKGLTVDLGRELGRRLGVPVDLVEFPQIADVLAAIKQGTVDFTLTNATPARAENADFSPTVLGVELGYLVPRGSLITTLSTVDRPGMRVGVTAGGSSHAALMREFKQAAVVPAATLQAAVSMLTAGQLDAYATNKAVLFEIADQVPGARVLDGRWGMERFALAIPKNRGQALEFIRRFAESVRTEDLVSRAAERAGLRGNVSSAELDK